MYGRCDPGYGIMQFAIVIVVYGVFPPNRSITCLGMYAGSTTPTEAAPVGGLLAS